MNKKAMVLLSIVERDKGKKLIKELVEIGVGMNLQCVGSGTAPTEMMDIFGLGTKDKDIVISLANEDIVMDLMANFGTTFESHSKYGGLMIVLKMSAISRILNELLNYKVNINNEKGNENMKNENHNNLILISVNEGYAEDVMQAARKAGATGGTVIKGRLADVEQFAAIGENIADEREILCILAPRKTSNQIMDSINKEFGITSDANGTIFAVPAEKAYKI